MTIPEHRKAIDSLDAQIVKFLNERTRHVLAIGEIKQKAGEEIYAPHRERAVLNRISKLNGGPITNESLHAIYREIMSSALSLEKSMKIAYLGPEATFTHQAAIRRFGSSLKYSPQKIEYAVDRYTNEARRLYGVMDKRLAKSTYLAGPEYSIADMAVFPWLRSWKNQGIDWNDHPHLKGWFDEIGKRPAVQRGVEVLADLRKPLMDDKARDTLFGQGQYRRDR